MHTTMWTHVTNPTKISTAFLILNFSTCNSCKIGKTQLSMIISHALTKITTICIWNQYNNLVSHKTSTTQSSMFCLVTSEGSSPHSRQFDERGIYNCAPDVSSVGKMQRQSAIFFYIAVTGQLWRMFLNLKSTSSTMPGKITETTQSWEEASGLAKNRDRWRIVPTCTSGGQYGKRGMLGVLRT